MVVYLIDPSLSGYLSMSQEKILNLPIAFLKRLLLLNKVTIYCFACCIHETVIENIDVVIRVLNILHKKILDFTGHWFLT